MTITKYLDAVKDRLLVDQIVSGFCVVRERCTLMDGHLRARLELVDGSQVEFSEYVQALPEDQVKVITYSYHWADAEGNLIRRWDNTPHFPDLPGFPHHLHNGRTSTVGPCQPVDIFSVLDEITRLLAL